MTDYIKREAVYCALDNHYFPGEFIFGEAIDQIPAADVVPWDWLYKYAEGKRPNYASDFIIERRLTMAKYVDADDILGKLPNDLPYKGVIKRVLMMAPVADVETGAEYRELLHAARKMHEWIFLNTGDEMAAYDECGLSDEMNMLLGYGGRIEFTPLAEEDDNDVWPTTLHPIPWGQACSLCLWRTLGSPGFVHG